MQGSEHKLEGEALPMELHLVHWNTKYRDVEEAVGKKDGLAVVAFLYQVGNCCCSKETHGNNLS